LAGAPDDADHEPSGLSRVRRLARVGWTALALALVALFAGLGWLASLASHSGDDAPARPPDVAAPPPTNPMDRMGLDQNALPPSVRAYLEDTLYPPGTGRLSPSSRDLLDPNGRYEDFRPIPETFSQDPGEIMNVRLTSDRYYYEGADPIELSLALRRGNERSEPLSIDAGATREGRAGLEGSRMSLRFSLADEGYAATLDPARFADHHGPVVVDARIEYAPGVFHDEMLRLFVTPEGMIPARFTGRVEDTLVNGSLLVQVGIDVDQPGDYRVDANLYDRLDRPIAFSAFKGPLHRGDRDVPIEFFGRLLIDSGALGPFRVGEIRGYRFLDGRYPDRERIPPLPGRYPTRDYGLASFSPDEYMGPEKLRMVELLLEDVERGIAIDLPPTPDLSRISSPDSAPR